MATYVLVPGGGWGGFIWRPVTSLLRAAGHEVFTPTLTGLGERAHRASPTINLATHVQDIVGVLAYEDLSAAILVWGIATPAWSSPASPSRCRTAWPISSTWMPSCPKYYSCTYVVRASHMARRRL